MDIALDAQRRYPIVMQEQVRGSMPPPMDPLTPSTTPRSPANIMASPRPAGNDQSREFTFGEGDPAVVAREFGREQDDRCVTPAANSDAGSSVAHFGSRRPSTATPRCMRPHVSFAGSRCTSFQDKLEALSQVHDQEVARLCGQVVDLQDLVAQYELKLRKVQGDYDKVKGELLCAASDGPAMCDLMMDVAADIRTGALWDESRDPCASEYAPLNDAAYSRHTKSSTQGLSVDTSCADGKAGAGRRPRLNKHVSPQEVDDLQRRLSADVSRVLPAAIKREHVRMSKLRQRKKIKKQTTTAHRTCLQQVVEHTTFDLFCAFMIINNSILIGFEVQWLTFNTEEPAFTKVLGLVCTVFFLGELVLRILAAGVSNFFINTDNRNWNWFDFVLVAMSFFDVASFVGQDGSAASIGMGLKTVKMLRIVRVVRVFRFFSKLSQLALMIIDSVKSLMWALIMLGIVIYVFAIFFTHYASEHVRLQEKSEASLEIAQHFGDLWATLYTLFHCMLNGISWYTIPIALYTIPGWTGPFLAVGFVGYLSFTMLAVMNIITGVFVDNAVETARTQREFLVQKEMEVKEQWLREMRAIFMEMDTDGSGTVTLAEITEFCDDARVQYYLTALGLDVQDTQRLFELLDENHDGELDVDEFLAGCLRLKGMARSIDVYSLIHLSRQIHRRVDELSDHCCGSAKPVGSLRSSQQAIGMPPPLRAKQLEDCEEASGN